MELTEDIKEILVKSFHHTDTKKTRKLLNDLYDQGVIDLVHLSTELLFLTDLSEYCPKIRCANKQVNSAIKSYKPGIVQDATYMYGLNYQGTILIYIFLSNIDARRKSTGCIGVKSKIYMCDLCIYEFEISEEYVKKYLV